MNIFEQCPKCGKITEGIPVYGTARQGVRAGTKWVTNKLIINYVALPILGTCVFPIVGTFFGFIIAVIVGAYISKTAENVTDSLDLRFNSSVPFEFKCSHCRNIWKRTYEKGIDYTTDPVLKWEKSVLAENIRSHASSNSFYAVYAGIFALPCAYYCLTHYSDQSSFLIWWLAFIIGMPALTISVSNGIMSLNRRKEANYLESMTVSEFRNSAYRAGNPFVGTVKLIEEANPKQQKVISQPLPPKIIVPVTEEHTRPFISESSDSIKEDIAKLDELLTAGILTEDEYNEQKNKIAPYTAQSAIQTPPQKTKVDAKVENNKIAILHNLKLLLDSEVLTPEEFREQKQSTLSVASIPWDKNKSRYEILEEMKSLLDAGILSQDEFDFHKKTILSDNK